MLESKLKRVALGKIWCSLYQDNPSIIELTKISPKGGYLRVGRPFSVDVGMPKNKGVFHLYMIGGNSTDRLNFPNVQEQWIKYTDWVNSEQIRFILYTDTGIVYPTYKVFVAIEYDGNILVAIEEDLKICNLNTTKVYMHITKPFYWTGNSPIEKSKQFRIDGLTTVNDADIVNFKDIYNNKINLKTGKKWFYHNGMFRQNFNYGNFKKGDNLEYVIDTSVVKTYDADISKLRFFTSDLDHCQKYLIQLPLKTIVNNEGTDSQLDDYRTVIYRDDIEIYVYRLNPDNAVLDGFYYNRNEEKSLRMVTHRAFSIPVVDLQNMIRTYDSNLDLRKWRIRLYVRRSGLNRIMMTDTNRVLDLYRLDGHNINLITEIMAGGRAALEEWTATKLESSWYNYIMRARREEITEKNIIDALGYYGSSSIMAESIVNGSFSHNRLIFDIPFGLIGLCTIFEYDENGHLLTWNLSSNNAQYVATDKNCRFIEILSGGGSRYPEIHYNPIAIAGIPDCEYRFYLSKNGDSTVTDKSWVDITKNTDHVKPVAGTNDFSLVYSSETNTLVVFGDKEWLCYDHYMPTDSVKFHFSLTYRDTNTLLPMQYQEIDIFLNGKLLVEGIDYYYYNSEICIVNKTHIDYTLNRQRITIRARGFLDKNCTRKKPRDIGFIQKNKISYDGYYGVIDDNLTKVNLGGQLYDTSILTEQSSDDTYIINIGKNLDGLPYQLSDRYVTASALKLTNSKISAYDTLEKDNEIIGRVEAFYNENYPKAKFPDHIKIESDWYELYSPFMAAIIENIKMIPNRALNVNSGNKESVSKFVSPFTKLLRFDPIKNNVDLHFCMVHPVSGNKPVRVSRTEYKLIQAVNDTYLDGKVNLTAFIKT